MGQCQCNNKCAQWKGMMNFIYGLPKYAVGDQCITCKRLWVPKRSIVRCPCCHQRLRTSDRYSRGAPHTKTKNKNLTKEQITEIIKENVEKGWRPLKIGSAGDDYMETVNKKVSQASR